MEAAGLFRSESGLAIRCSDAAVPSGRTLTLRPEKLSIVSDPAAADNSFPGTVEFASYLGGILEYYVRLTPEDRLMVQAPNKLADGAFAVGDSIHLTWPAQASLVLADDGGGTG
jgi:ABC-type Fe3+/spermidine/putrescine transport system ATPase subunit